MKRVVTMLGIVVLLTGMLSCDDSFNPSAPFQPKMVVYSILSNQSDTQLVRIYTTYSARNNADEISVSDAIVKVIGKDSLRDPRTRDFRAFDLTRPDQSRYKSDIKAYYCYPFKPVGAAAYMLTVTSPTYGSVTADLTFPDRGSVKFGDIFNLENPWNHPFDITLSIKLSRLVKAFLVRLFVEYDLFNPQTGLWNPYRTEVPFKVNVISKTMELYEYLYPQITRRQTPQNFERQSSPLDSYTFQVSAYQTVVYQIVSHADHSRFKRAVCYLIQFDEQLYRYYYDAHQFYDKNSIRLDLPDYTNVYGGVGLFASTAIDSVDWLLPERICPPPGPNVICN